MSIDTPSKLSSDDDSKESDNKEARSKPRRAYVTQNFSHLLTTNILDLPPEQLSIILSFDDPQDIAAAAATCRGLRKIVNDDQKLAARKYLYDHQEQLGLNGKNLDKVLAKLPNIQLLLRNSRIHNNLIPDPRAPLREAIFKEQEAFLRDKAIAENRDNRSLNTAPIVPSIFPGFIISLFSFSCFSCGSEVSSNPHEENIKRYQEELNKLENEHGPFDRTIETEVIKIKLSDIETAPVTLTSSTLLSLSSGRISSTGGDNVKSKSPILSGKT